MALILSSPVRFLTGVGPALAEKLAKLGIHQVVDLLFHLPRDYQDRTKITSINQLQIQRYAQIEGTIIQNRTQFGKRRSLLISIEDQTGSLQMRLFHFSHAQKAQLSQGTVIRCFGEVRLLNQGLEMIHPEYQLSPEPLHEGRSLTALYPSTEGISQTLFRKLIDQALNVLKKDQNDITTLTLPPALKHLDIDLKVALVGLHHPAQDADLDLLQQGLHPFQQRLAFEELLAHQFSLLQAKAARKAKSAPCFHLKHALIDQLIHNLPFKLAPTQTRTLNDISQDIASGQPMLRLVQGDVGSGKTIVAALACCGAIAAGHQAVIMAPTEILAEQHFTQFEAWLSPLNINITLLLGRHSKKQKAQKNEAIAQGEVALIIGTHALIEETVQFNQLSMIIIDEQHRFGVHQRLALVEKARHNNTQPHQLVLSATPIPRTLAMTAYADLDLSIIDSLPPGRKPIKTRLLSQKKRDQLMDRIQSLCERGQQVYWVCTLIEESEVIASQPAEQAYELLKQALPQLQIGLVHGKLKAKEKAAIMQAFVMGKIDLLVATTVIEVGVNVPNASVMVIENPERLGLAQLHQLRGRVGRGHLESYCLLLYQSPLSQHAKSRLQLLRESQDGFYLSEQDLLIRGPGELLGEKQTGLLSFRIADLERDQPLLDQVQDYATDVKLQDPLQSMLIKRWLVDPDYYING